MPGLALCLFSGLRLSAAFGVHWSLHLFGFIGRIAEIVSTTTFPGTVF
jgi:hypothetical protein